MIVAHGEMKSLRGWLESQERVVRFWIDEAASAGESAAGLIDKLERHRNWLAAFIAELGENQRRMADAPMLKGTAIRGGADPSRRDAKHRSSGRG